MVDNVLDYLDRANRYLTVSELVKMLRKHRETIYTHIREDGLPAMKDGHLWKIPSAGLADWIRRRTSTESPTPAISTEIEIKAVKKLRWPKMRFLTGPDRRRAVNEFIFYIFQTTGKVISRTDIWKIRMLPSGEMAGYKTKSDFNQWQRGAGTKPAARYLESILSGELIIF